MGTMAVALHMGYGSISLRRWACGSGQEDGESRGKVGCKGIDLDNCMHLGC